VAQEVMSDMSATATTTRTGRVVRVIGAVVDVEFPRDAVPELFNACHTEITFEAVAKTLTLEVAQHLGDNLVRCISMQPTDGLVRGATVTDSGAASAVCTRVAHRGRMTLGSLGHGAQTA